MPPPKTLPADFFDKQGASSPQTLPANFFDQQSPAPVDPPKYSTASMSAVKPPASKSEAVEQWAQKFINDLKNGTDATGLGSILKKMGAPGLHSGTSEEVGDMMGSVPLGLTRMAKGAAEGAQSGKRWQGTKDVVGGAMEVGTIPSMMTSPEAAGAVPKLLPSTEKAGKLLDAVEKAAGHVEVNVNGPGKAAMRFYENVQHGGSPSQIINKFLQRVTKADAPPLTYAEARKFYENATRISFDMQKRLNPKAKYLLTEFTKELGHSIYSAASEAGQGENYVKAMNAYRSASKFGHGVKAAGKAAMVGAGAYGTYDLLRAVMGQR